ncbi:MAG: nicotinamide mononucleotide transporter pnuc [Flavobacteriales bacterium]|nr:nicotinamide mononucleotide transporter pnuc [Flavobacteriales bacterium]|tara:strand:- start:8452 stop:9045 length:594 start_codon:yes stop_codon:yes gene_type:complete
MQEFFQILTNIKFNWSIIETIAVFFSVIYVVLAARESIWCWVSAFISVSLYIHICYTAKLYPETGLQIFYLIMAGVGYYMWNKQNKEEIKEWSVFTHLGIIVLGAILTFFIGFYFATYTDSVMPITDSFTTIFSLIATYMVVKKVLGNWLYWIVIDLVSVYLYFNRDLHLTSLLFFAYTIIAIFGYFSWVNRMKING